MDKLRAHGRSASPSSELGYRSAFVGAVLAALPGARTNANPAMVTLGPPWRCPAAIRSSLSWTVPRA